MSLNMEGGVQVTVGPEKLPSTPNLLPPVVDAKFPLPRYYNFRRHFTSDTHYFYRLHYDGMPLFSRTDTITGDVLIYSGDEGALLTIQQLYYFKVTFDSHGILVFGKDGEVYIGLVSLCHEKRSYTVVSKESYRCFAIENILQATLVRNHQHRNQIICIFEEENDKNSSQSCIVFFKIDRGEVRIVKSIFLRSAIYFAFWSEHYIYGVTKVDSQATTYNLVCYNLISDQIACVKENLLSFLKPDEIVNDFCWYKFGLHMFVLHKSNRQVYIQKFDIYTGTCIRIELPVRDYGKTHCDLRFCVDTDGAVCYCVTSKNVEECLMDRFIRLPVNLSTL